MKFRLAFAALAAAALAGCAGRPAAPSGIPAPNPAAAMNDEHVPDFARKPYGPFSREDAVAIAMREWRLFGQPVDDDPPDTRPPPLPDEKPERMPGLWQRVGEYWYEGIDPDRKETSWTGKHDEFGSEFAAARDGDYAWSAAFISYVMRLDGAGARFPYSPDHADYINIARDMSLGRTAGYAIEAEPPWAYAPQPGDLICTGRGSAANMRFERLPTASFFPSHCDMVVMRGPGVLSVVGGNVDDAVTMKHVPTTADGMIAGPDGRSLDPRYNWFVVLRVLYDQ